MSASRKPASSAAANAPNEPCPGTTTTSARRTSSGSAVATMSFGTVMLRSSARSTLRRLPTPVASAAIRIREGHSTSNGARVWCPQWLFQVAKILGRTLSIGFLATLVFSCAAVQNATNKAGVPGAAKCPDMANVDAILDYDFASNFKINAEAGGKLKAGTAAAVSLKGFADEIDARPEDRLRRASSKDLGGAGDLKDGKIVVRGRDQG